MRLAKFLLRFVFICNLCYLAGYLLRITEDPDRFAWITKHIIVLGYIVALPANILTSIYTIIILISGKTKWKEIPYIVFILNLLILLIQIFQ
ncbi:hypothetical protein KTO58_12365 [Chitinophaga pendula]|uniref:hypothetical protein n=1 Tax=Chitinophaga TaxID=79328 RepID=UPI000BAF5BA9|nr:MULTISPECIES: hypothetical protein [Chitinophaga]ASZ12451.1 hypothetical protein CK934_16525 [Chitinophaga sp. MD30]UCJ09953.1 hypothetical protein KTO58_12365 [Chitinophaga pendula]